jgi:hypothetical protein
LSTDAEDVQRGQFSRLPCTLKFKQKKQAYKDKLDGNIIEEFYRKI